VKEEEKSRHALETIQDQLATELHDTLAKELTRLLVITRGLKERNVDASISQELGNLEVLASNAMQSLRPIISRLSVSSREDSVEEILQTCQVMLRDRNITLQSDIAPELLVTLSDNQRQILTTVLQEGSLNILKYAAAGSTAVITLMEIEEQTFECSLVNTIDNNISGSSSISGGYGLRHLARTVNTAGGYFEQITRGNMWMISAVLPQENPVADSTKEQS
ncbi:MAG: histidine kinase, partial [Actinomycetaceae bacterium]|nr:histidine kinase [Actinomycetaceae bacterium]